MRDKEWRDREEAIAQIYSGNLPKRTLYRCADCGMETEDRDRSAFHVTNRPGSCAWFTMSRTVATWNPEYRAEDPETFDLAIWEVELCQH